LLAFEERATNIVLLWAAAISAFLIRRMGAPLIIVAAILTIAQFVRTITRRTRRAVLEAAAIGLALPVGIGAVWPLLPPDVHRGFTWLQFDMAGAARTVATNASQLPAFFHTLLTTFWLSAGWLRYPGPSWWHALTVAIAVVALGGLLRHVRSGNVPSVFWLATAMVLLQLAAVVIYELGILHSGPQGRYLFPVLPAIFTLMWLGWRNIVVAPEHEPLAAVALVGLVAGLNVTSWTLVILPAYA
jgi:hypothetical protein